MTEAQDAVGADGDARCENEPVEQQLEGAIRPLPQQSVIASVLPFFAKPEKVTVP